MSDMKRIALLLFVLLRWSGYAWYISTLIFQSCSQRSIGPETDLLPLIFLMSPFGWPSLITDGNRDTGSFQANARVDVASANAQARASFIVMLIWRDMDRRSLGLLQAK
jgi:hypothetical protein